MKQLPSFRTILLLAVASLTMVAVVPWRQQAAATDNLDDSLLLLAASKARQAALQSSIKSPNELRVLAAAYRQQAEKLRKSSNSLHQSMYEKANKYDEQAKALERRRARGGPLRQFGHLLGRVVGRTMNLVGRAAESYIEGEIDKAIDKVANAPARALQRRLNPLWKILGSKLGGGLTGFLREPIDRAIQRNVDRILYGRPHRSRPRTAVPTATTDPGTPIPSSTSVGTLAGFQVSDCAVPGVTFASPTIGDEVNEVFDGPSLICAASSEGAHGLSEFALIGITALKADQLEGRYQQAVESIRRFVDKANEWNALPDLPPAARYEIDLILNDEDGYVFMITSESNVYDCLLGSGYGEEKIEGKYLVNIQFESCELGDAAAYTAALESLRAAALAAIERVETARQK